MGLILYKIIFSVIHLNEHWPTSKWHPTWPTVPHSRIESQLPLWCWCWQVFENNSLWLLIIILGTVENHKVMNLENKDLMEAQECNYFARNSWTDIFHIFISLRWWVLVMVVNLLGGGSLLSLLLPSIYSFIDQYIKLNDERTLISIAKSTSFSIQMQCIVVGYIGS